MVIQSQLVETGREAVASSANIITSEEARKR